MNYSEKKLLFPFYILVLFVLSMGCQPQQKPLENADIEPVSYLALGDSYTIGTGIEVDNSYPYQLADTLRAKGITVDTTHIIATNGWTTTDLKKGISENTPDSAFNLVSLLIGVNNQYQWLDIELYRTEFRELLEQSIEFAGGKSENVFVISIPNYGVTPFAQSKDPDYIRRKITEYNGIAEEISSEYDIPFINITPISELAEDDLSLLASDELHPSAKMYSMWIDEMLPTITEILLP